VSQEAPETRKGKDMTTDTDVKDDVETEASTDEELGIIHLVDNAGKPLKIEQIRGKLSGEIFISFDLADMPPEGAKFVATIAGEVRGKYEFEEKSGVWIAYRKLQVHERRSFTILEGEEDDTGPDLFEDQKWMASVDELYDALRVDRDSLTDAAAEAREAGWSIVGFARAVRAGATRDVSPIDSVRVLIQLDQGDIVQVPEAEETPAE
jgi:hypothetical protein